MRSLFLLLLFAYVPSQLQASCDNTIKPIQASARNLLPSTPLIAYHPNGLLLRIPGKRHSIDTLSNHRMESMGTLLPSDQGRYLVYGNTFLDATASPFYLYDFERSRDTLLLSMPAYDMVALDFSGDQQYLAIGTVFHPHRQELAKEGIHVYHLPELHHRFYPYPDSMGIAQKDVRGSLLHWARDSHQLLLRYNTLGKNRQEIYWRLDIASGQYTRITGRTAATLSIFKDPPRFFEQGAEIATHSARTLQWQTFSPSPTRSPQGGFTAQVRNDQLEIQSPGGFVKIVDSAAYDDCLGYAIAIHGWIDERYLVYNKAGITYVFDAQKLTSQHLFDSGYEFYW